MCSKCAYRGYSYIRGDNPHNYQFEKALCHDTVLCDESSPCPYCEWQIRSEELDEEARKRRRRQAVGGFVEGAVLGTIARILIEPFLPDD